MFPEQFHGQPLSIQPSEQNLKSVRMRRPAEAAAADRLMEALIRKGPPPALPASLLPLPAAQPCLPLLAPAAAPLMDNGAVAYILTTADVFVA